MSSVPKHSPAKRKRRSSTTSGSRQPDGKPALRPSPFADEDQIEIRKTLPSRADSDAVLRALAELYGWTRDRELHEQCVAVRENGGRTVFRSLSPGERRDRWKAYSDRLRAAALALHELRPLRTTPDGDDWYKTHLRRLKKSHEWAETHIEAFTMLSQARRHRQDPYIDIIHHRLLSIWTDIAGGNLRVSRPRGRKGAPGGAAVRFLEVVRKLIPDDGRPVPGPSRFAQIIESEKKVRAGMRSRRKNMPG